MQDTGRKLEIRVCQDMNKILTTKPMFFLCRAVSIGRGVTRPAEVLNRPYTRPIPKPGPFETETRDQTPRPRPRPETLQDRVRDLH